MYYSLEQTKKSMTYFGTEGALKCKKKKSNMNIHELVGYV